MRAEPKPARAPNIAPMNLKLLLAVDGSRYTRRMLTYIVSNELLFRPEQELVLCHVASEADSARHASEVYEPLWEAKIFLQVHGFHPQTLVVKGDPASALAVVARDLQSNLVVMGYRGQSRLESVVMGSVTAQLLAQSHIPVLVVP